MEPTDALLALLYACFAGGMNELEIDVVIIIVQYFNFIYLLLTALLF
jgi:hypothetical protein